VLYGLGFLLAHTPTRTGCRPGYDSFKSNHLLDVFGIARADIRPWAVATDDTDDAIADVEVLRWTLRLWHYPTVHLKLWLFGWNVISSKWRHGLRRHARTCRGQVLGFDAHPKITDVEATRHGHVPVDRSSALRQSRGQWSWTPLCACRLLRCCNALLQLLLAACFVSFFRHMRGSPRMGSLAWRFTGFRGPPPRQLRWVIGWR
jgi:hypothetical protein